MKIATGNLERPTDLADQRAVSIHQQTEPIDVDIWIITGTLSKIHYRQPQKSRLDTALGIN